MRWTVLTVTGLLAACGHKAAVSNEANAPGNPAANASAAATPLPPAGSGPRFVGTWAASQAECKSKPWRFTATALDGAGGPRCSFYKVSKGPDGYDIAATCPAKKPLPTDLIKLRFTESAGTILVESNAIPPTGLVYCGK